MQHLLIPLLRVMVGGRGITTWANGLLYNSTGRAKLLVQERDVFADCTVQIVVTRGWRSELISEKA